MKMKDNFIIALACLCAISMYRSCDMKKRLELSNSEVLELIDYQSAMTVQINEQGREINKQKAIYLSEKSKNESLVDKIKKLESTISKYEVATRTVVREIKVPLLKTDTIYLNGDTLQKSPFRLEDSNFSISGYATSSELFIDSLWLEDKLTLQHKWERKNILSKKQYVIEAYNENPYVQIRGMNNYTFYEEKKWHERRGVNILVGFLIGSAINSR